MKRLAWLALALLSVLSIGERPDLGWVTERPLCVDTPYSHVCGPNMPGVLGS